MRELGSVYEATRSRISRLVSEVDDPSAVPIPACPEWSAHDLVSHLTGNCADTIAGNVDGVATTAWTDRQVQERRTRSTAEVLEEWDEVGPVFAAMIDDLPGNIPRMPVGDIAVHEHDLRGALGEPGARDSRAVEVAVGFMVDVFVKTAAKAFGLGPLEISTPEHSWVVGTGEEPSRDEEAWKIALAGNGHEEPALDPVAGVTMPTFELFRAVGGRRTSDQIKDFDWNVDPEPYLSLFGYGVFSLRSEPLDE